VRARAVEFLRSYRDSGAGQLDIGPEDRLPRSLALTAGLDVIPEDQIEMWIEELALDLWARGHDWRQQPPPDRLAGFSAIVIGAGMGGLNAAVQLKHAGIDFTVIEKNSGVGGTWFENRYPGCRVDSPSRSYTHIFGVDYLQRYGWCPWEENRNYFDWVADTFEVRNKIVFDTEVQSLVWDEDSAEWELRTEGPDGSRVWRANLVISAVGILSRPNMPTIPGMDDFQGLAFHSARWPEDSDLDGKRVAVIGTGCSGYQMIPELALEAGHVYAFQRTPQWIFDVSGYRSPFPEQVGWLDRNLPYHTNFMRFLAHWHTRPETQAKVFDVDPQFDDHHARSALNKQIRDARIEFLERKLAKRPELIEKMIPEHPPFSARMVIADTEYSVVDALLRDNVTLVTDAIERITPTGITTTGGVEHPIDVIVYATGFKANEFLWPMSVQGREGRLIDEVWSEDGPRAYLGSMVPGFPNFFVLYGPNSNPFGGGLQVVNYEEMVTRFALRCIEHLLVEGRRSVDVNDEAYRRYNALVDHYEDHKMYRDARAHTYYRDERFGRSATNNPIPMTDVWRWLREPNYEDLEVR
jgi:4-hydroxyacetophenone monooxygenase